MRRGFKCTTQRPSSSHLSGPFHNLCIQIKGQEKLTEHTVFFFDINAVVRYEFVPQGKTVNEYH